MILKELIKEYYNNPKYKYPKIIKIFKNIRKYWFLFILKIIIKEYIEFCFIYKQNKAENYLKYRFLQKIKLL